jgi:hypothetical protein
MDIFLKTNFYRGVRANYVLIHTRSCVFTFQATRLRPGAKLEPAVPMLAVLMKTSPEPPVVLQIKQKSRFFLLHFLSI